MNNVSLPGTIALGGASRERRPVGHRRWREGEAGLPAQGLLRHQHVEPCRVPQSRASGHRQPPGRRADPQPLAGGHEPHRGCCAARRGRQGRAAQLEGAASKNSKCPRQPPLLGRLQPHCWSALGPRSRSPLLLLRPTPRRPSPSRPKDLESPIRALQSDLTHRFKQKIAGGLEVRLQAGVFFFGGGGGSVAVIDAMGSAVRRSSRNTMGSAVHRSERGLSAPHSQQSTSTFVSLFETSAPMIFLLFLK